MQSFCRDRERRDNVRAVGIQQVAIESHGEEEEKKKEAEEAQKDRNKSKSECILFFS